MTKRARRRSTPPTLEWELLRATAAQLLKDCRSTAPHDPWAIADHLRIPVCEEPLRGVDGYIARHGDDGLRIVLDDSASRSRKRFTLAHELGHAVLARAHAKHLTLNLVRYRSNHGSPTLQDDPIEERLCNWFAAELLMPRTEVLLVLHQQPLSPELPLSLADRFGVSIHAAATRIVENTPKDLVGFGLWARTPWPVQKWSVGLTLKASADRFDDPTNRASLAEVVVCSKKRLYRLRSRQVGRDQTLLAIAPAGHNALLENAKQVKFRF
jgi:hypothetical protein